MKKSFIMILLLGIAVLGLQAFKIGTPQPQYSNLQVLPQDISKTDLDSIMEHFSKALDVKCSFCHYRDEKTRQFDFASDIKKEKATARGMMHLVMDININQFEKYKRMTKGDNTPLPELNSPEATQYLLKKITCYTCHHGNAHPLNFPPEEHKK